MVERTAEMTATEKQIGYIHFLAKKVDLTLTTAREKYFGVSGLTAPLSRRDASELIDWLKA
jgi:hypothetical protein